MTQKWNLLRIVHEYQNRAANKKQHQIRLSSLESRLKQKKCLPTLVSGSLRVLTVWRSACNSAARIVLNPSDGNWEELVRLLRHQAIGSLSHIAMARLTKQQALSLGPFRRELDFTDVTEGGLMWASAITFRQNKLATTWGDWLLKTISSRTPLVEIDGFRELCAFGLWTIHLHALWREKPFTFDAKPEGWDAYQAVLDSWHSERRFAKAVEGICEFHCNNWSDDAPTLDAPFYGAPFAIFPVEIIALRRIRADLNLPFPKVKHPLISGNPLSNVPARVTPPKPDELELRVLTQIRRSLPKFAVPMIIPK